MAALQYAGEPNYAAIIFRKTFRDLSLPGAIMDRAHKWLDDTDAHWSEGRKTWTFPSGATLTFAYLQHDNDKYAYQGSEYQFVGFDELTQFTSSQYTYLFSRLRRLKGSRIPIRARSASNPGGRGHAFVKQRFIVEGPEKGRVFVPATLIDNPHLDREEYLESLKELDPITREQLLNGDWDARMDGNKFKQQWFKIVTDYPKGVGKTIRYWDLAATEASPGKDPAYTAGVKMMEHEGQYWVIDIKRTQATPKGVEDLIYQTAMMDGRDVAIHMEQEPGSSGVNTIDYYQRKVLKGFAFYGDKVTGSKEVRANPVSSAAEAGNVYLVEGSWIGDFIDEAVSYPHGKKDQIDALAQAYTKLHEVEDRKTYVSPTVGGIRRKPKN